MNFFRLKNKMIVWRKREKEYGFGPGLGNSKGCLRPRSGSSVNGLNSNPHSQLCTCLGGGSLAVFPFSLNVFGVMSFVTPLKFPIPSFQFRDVIVWCYRMGTIFSYTEAPLKTKLHVLEI